MNRGARGRARRRGGVAEERRGLGGKSAERRPLLEDEVVGLAQRPWRGGLV